MNRDEFRNLMSIEVKNYAASAAKYRKIEDFARGDENGENIEKIVNGDCENSDIKLEDFSEEYNTIPAQPTYTPFTPPLTNTQDIPSALDAILAIASRLEAKLDAMDQKIVHLEEQLVAERADHAASSETLRSFKVILQQVHNKMCALTGHSVNDLVEEIAASLPVSSLEALIEMEEKLKLEDYSEAMGAFILRVKGQSSDVSPILKQIMADELLVQFNWDGRNGKRGLDKLFLIKNSVYGAFQSLGLHQFIKEMRKSVELSHKRLAQKKYRQKP